MSTKGIYTALSGAIAQNQRLESVANNIANVNTPSFKKDNVVFQEYLTVNEKGPESLKIPRIPASNDSFYDQQGRDKSYVDVNGSFTDFTQGALEATRNPLDLALNGDGFFEVLVGNEIRYTRDGAFKIDNQGQLVTKEGYPVLRRTPQGTPPEDRLIRLNPGASGNLFVAENGLVSQGENLIAQLSVVTVDEKPALKKEARLLYSLKPNYNTEMRAATGVEVKQGFIEKSNVNIVQEMTDMISATRLFESTQKAISAYDSMADKLVNVVPKSN